MGRALRVLGLLLERSMEQLRAAVGETGVASDPA
jgi:hypothetical protein